MTKRELLDESVRVARKVSDLRRRIQDSTDYKGEVPESLLWMLRVGIGWHLLSLLMSPRDPDIKRTVYRCLDQAEVEADRIMEEWGL